MRSRVFERVRGIWRWLADPARRVELITIFSISLLALGSFYVAHSQGGSANQNNYPGGASRGTGANTIYVADYNPTPYQVAFDATWSSSGTTVTITSGDAPLTPALNNQLCFGMPSLTGGPSAPGTFTYISATSGTCAPSGSLVGAPTGTGAFAVGQDSTPAFLAATAALYALPHCGQLVIPAGYYFLSTGVGSANVPNSNCNQQSPPGTASSGITISGQGYTSTFLTPLPGFVFTASGTKGCVTTGCFWSTTSANITFSNFTIDGQGQNLTGVSTSPANNCLFYLGANSLAFNVDLFNWGNAASNSPPGVCLTGSGAYGLGLSSQNFGATNANILCNSPNGLFEFSAANSTLQISSAGTCYDHGGQYTGIFGNGGTLYGDGTRSIAQASGTTASVASPGSFILSSSSIGVGSNGSGTCGISIASGATLYAKNTVFNGGSSGGSICGAGTFVDQGGNTFQATTTPFTGNYISVGGGSMATQQTSAATNFGANLTAQTLVSSVISKTNLNVLIQARQSLAGVGCGAGSNTVFATITYTAPGGTVSSVTTSTLSVSANGGLDLGANSYQSVVLPVKAGTTVTYTTTSVLASTGCSTVPQYTVDARVN